ncbi:DNA-binding transcriptional LysR family regulator [Kribbella orskensis]|uniref:DNA-binding transcriptional LysR family regulator n=1 Tax=Kribbella orskensis TaxID=2512216 RepID=A0ABY2BD08_9ACTN|nr:MULTISPECIES: LysR family transcriptional regulator [Kribbella]TCN35340.1 DNA-binding transcriptional LysR family regulator [Kribbella sp. VKM Ac-2500]TCO16761.1 DNA-binding transcriptional LysR family regulator [Kribbella orskensis]
MILDRLVAEDLEAFAIFAKHRNFTHAADELHVSQPALHARIRKLEQTLGRQLYERQGRTLLLTETGEHLAAFANDTRSRAAAFLEGLDALPPRPLVLAAGSGAYLYVIGDVLRRYLDRKLGLRLMTTDSDATVAAVRDGTADVGVTALTIPPDDLDCELLTQYSQVLAVRPDHRLADRRTVRLKDLQGEALVVPPQTRPHRRQLERSLLDAGVDWSVAVEAEGWVLQVHFVRMGIAPAVVNGFVRTPATVRTIPIKDLPPIRYYLVTRRNRRADGRLDTLGALLTRFVV